MENKIIDEMQARILEFIETIKKGKYEPQNYEFALSITTKEGKEITIKDSY